MHSQFFFVNFDFEICVHSLSLSLKTLKVLFHENFPPYAKTNFETIPTLHFISKEGGKRRGGQLV